MQLEDIPLIASTSDSQDIDQLCFQYDAMIRLFFKENPDQLNDDEFARRVKELKFLSEQGFLKSI
jgi:hypothetical protein